MCPSTDEWIKKLWYIYSCCLVAQLCLTLCDLIDCSLSCSSVHGISQPRILAWVAIFFCKGSSWPWARMHLLHWQMSSLPPCHQGSLVHIYDGTLLSHKKEHIGVNCTEVDEHRACYTEWSKSEREKQISQINAYIWNLEKWSWWIYLQDLENGIMDTEGEGESGTN